MTSFSFKVNDDAPPRSKLISLTSGETSAQATKLTDFGAATVQIIKLGDKWAVFASDLDRSMRFTSRRTRCAAASVAVDMLGSFSEVSDYDLLHRVPA